MTHEAIIPEAHLAASAQMKTSPAVRSGDHLFLTGMTGSDDQGRMPRDPEHQFRNAFDKITAILKEAGAGPGHIVEMTTYHTDLREQFDLFATVRADYVDEPYPAWTAVEVAGLRREGAYVEIRVVARVETPGVS